MGLTKTVAAAALIGAAAAGSVAYRTLSVAVVPVAEQTKAVLTIKTAIAEIHEMAIAVSGIGNLQPLNTVQIKSRVDGPVEKVLFKEGEQVAAGEALIQIDPRLSRAAAMQAEGQLAHDQAQYQSAKADLDRAVNLVDKGFASKQVLEQRETAMAALQATIKMEKATLDLAQLNLDFTTIRAPISGRIGKRLVDAGNLIRAADGISLAEIVQTHPINGLFTISQGVLADVRAQMQAGPLVVDAISTDNRQVLGRGRLVLIGNEIERQSGTVELKAEFDNGNNSLWAGQLFEARMIVRTRTGVSVPTSAISTVPGGKAVFIINGEHKVKLRRVVAGPSNEGMTIIESGIAAGERVAVEKLDLLAPGLSVQVDEQAGNTGDATQS